MYRNDEIKSAKNKPQSIHVVKMTDICSAEHYMENGKYIPVVGERDEVRLLPAMAGG